MFWVYLILAVLAVRVVLGPVWYSSTAIIEDIILHIVIIVVFAKLFGAI